MDGVVGVNYRLKFFCFYNYFKSWEGRFFCISSGLGWGVLKIWLELKGEC